MNGPVRKLRVSFLIKSLGQGGSEYQLCLLARQMHHEGFQVRILVYGSKDNFYQDILPEDLPVESLGCGSRWNIPCLLLSLRRYISSTPTDVAYAFLSHSNMLLLIASAGLPVKVVCGLRTSDMAMKHETFVAKFGERLHRLMLRFADQIIVNTRKAATELPTTAMPVSIVYNGIDTDRFVFDVGTRVMLRASLWIPDNVTVIGMFGRYHPVKNHMMLIESLSMIPARFADFRLLFIGSGDESYKERLVEKAVELGLADKVIMLDGRKDINRYYSVLDIFCSCSDYEGFSNVLAEAMSVGLPCIATDVGESRNLLEGCGVLIPPSDAAALAAALVQTIERLNEGSPMLCRERIVRRFGLHASAQRTISILERLLDA